MNWEAIGALGEVAGALGVIFTLGYLALQIRYSNRLATWETHRASVASNADALIGVLNDPDIAKIYRTGLMNPDELDEIEKMRFSQLLSQLVLNFKDTLDAYDKGLYDFPTYQAWQGSVCTHLKMPGGQLWWQDFESSFIQRVRDEINQGILEVPRIDAISPTFWSSGAKIEIKVPNPKRSTHEHAPDQAS
jgi:hypothetical protein